MGEPYRDPSLSVIVGAQNHRGVLAKSRRALSDVDGHVKYGSAQDTHQFGLGVWGLLKMEAAHDPCLLGARVVVLHEGGIDPSDLE